MYSLQFLQLVFFLGNVVGNRIMSCTSDDTTVVHINSVDHRTRVRMEIEEPLISEEYWIVWCEG